MKNVLILSGSPRRNGNSDMLCDRFTLGAREAGHNVEKIFLRDRKIGYCTGCDYCFKTHKCSQKDDMAEIIEKMIQADVLVFATPVYFYSMDAQMKTLIDRTLPRYTEMSHKECYFILTAAVTEKANLKRTVEGLRSFTEDCLEGTTERGVIYGTGAWGVGDVQNTPAYQEAYEMGKQV